MPLALRTVSLAVVTCLALLLGAMAYGPALAASEDEVRDTFERFVAAQNAHDEKALGGLLLDSPDFLWITRGTAVWGHDQAMKRFAGLFQATWQLAPDPSGLKVTMIGEDVAQLFVPILHHWKRRPGFPDDNVSDESSPPQDC